jgi:hypothetical protein
MSKERDGAMSTKITEPLRAGHRELLAELESLRLAAVAV